MPGVPYSIVRYFQSRVSALTGVTLDLLASPNQKKELGKAKLIFERCDRDLNLVMQVIEQELLREYVLDHPSLGVVHSNVERVLFTLRRQKEMAKRSGYLNRVPEEAPAGGYLNRDSQAERRLVL